MSENRTLLSQSEIDTLVSFLMTQKDVPIGNVLDQNSIDKLIELVKFNNERGIFFGREPGMVSLESSAKIIDPESDAEMKKEDCTLECEVGKDGFVRIYCRNKKSRKQYRLSPACIEQKRYVHEDDSEWGYCITPKHFNKLANLFGISYSKKTFDTVCKVFAKVCYGDENAKIAKVYFPPENE